jgi:hypothetical protein
VGARFEPRHEVVGEILSSPGMVAEMMRRVELGRIEAERLASVDTGNYAFGTPNQRGATGGAFMVTAGVRDGRAYGRLSNAARAKPSPAYPGGYMYSWALEFGNKRIRAQRVLGRCLDTMA